MYVTVAGVREALARDVTAPTGTAASLGDADLEAAITSAQAEVDAKLSARYVVPFSEPVPLLVREITRDIAAYLADLRYRQGKGYESDRDPVLLRYQRAQELLEKAATGALDLPGVDLAGGGPARMRPINRYPGRLFATEDFGLGVDGEGRLRPPYL